MGFWTAESPNMSSRRGHESAGCAAFMWRRHSDRNRGMVDGSTVDLAEIFQLSRPSWNACTITTSHAGRTILLFQSRFEAMDVLPWDVDLTWRNYMYGTGREPFLRVGVSAQCPEIADRIPKSLSGDPGSALQSGAGGDAAGRAIGGHLRPCGGRSFVEADRAKVGLSSHHGEPMGESRSRQDTGSSTSNPRRMILRGW